MKKFKLFGEMFFEADDIEDAFDKLAGHFRILSNGGEGIDLLSGTDVKIRVVEVVLDNRTR